MKERSLRPNAAGIIVSVQPYAAQSEAAASVKIGLDTGTEGAKRVPACSHLLLS